MTSCNKCKKVKDIEQFMSNDKQVKNCFDCREMSRKWRENNKNIVSLYNKTYNDNKSNKNDIIYVYAKKNNTEEEEEEWIKFNSQLEAAKLLGLHKENINKVINGSLKTTGGYIFKIEKEEIQIEKKDWKEVKEENNIVDKCKGQPSNKRTLHENIDGVIGKKCCKCKDWKPLFEYNNCKSHWDNLRVDCKECLVQWRKDNRKKISNKYVEYEKNRKLTDPEFKLVKTIRSRLSTALKSKNCIKNNSTIDYLGCSISHLKGYLEAKFKEGMTWDNHGEWHVDHIKPCASFNLTDESDINKCFHYTNLQPLWASENLSKGSKII